MKPRLHGCGHELDRVHAYELIPAGHYTFQHGEYRQTDSTEEGDEVYLEVRCPYCDEALKGRDRRVVLGQFPPEEG